VNRPYAIRPYDGNDESAVLGLLHQALGGERAFDRTNAFWHWKHFQNPFGASLLMVAENEELLGLRAFMRWQFLVDGVSLHAVRAVDTATHPGYRRHGVFATLTRLTVEQAQREGVDLVFNTPNVRSLPGYLKLGWAYLGRPRLLVRILRPVRVSQVLLGLAAEDREALPVPNAPAVPAASLLSRPELFRSLLRENDRLCTGIRTLRDAAFLHWRYAGLPSLRYYVCARGEPLAAAAIFRLNRRRGLREIMLCDLLLNDAGTVTVSRVIGDLI